MGAREDVAETLADRWAQLPDPTGEFEDRRPSKPLDPQPPRFYGNFPMDEKYLPEIIEGLTDPSGKIRKAMVPIGPTAPMAQDIISDIPRFAENEAKAPPAAHQYVGYPVERIFEPFTNKLADMRLMDSLGRKGGHLNYLSYRGDEPGVPYGRVQLGYVPTPLPRKDPRK